MDILALKSLPRHPWKNGGGVSTGIAGEPPGASYDACLWRIDLSFIERAGPFSDLAGLDRILTILAPGLSLTVDGATSTIAPFSPFAFSGDCVTTCALSDEARPPLHAFNVLTRRGEAKARVDIHPGSATVQPGSLATLLYVARGGFNVVEGKGRPTRLDSDHAALVRAGGEALAFEPFRPWSVAISVVVDGV